MNTTLPPPAFQAQLSSLFLQYATLPVSTSNKASRNSGNQSPASTEHRFEQPFINYCCHKFLHRRHPTWSNHCYSYNQPPCVYASYLIAILAAVTSNVLPLPSMAHGTPTEVTPSYLDAVQLPIPALLLPSIPATGWTLHAATTIDNTACSPPNGHQKIIQGEFIDFSESLHKATFTYTTADPCYQPNGPSKKFIPCHVDASLEPVSISYSKSQPHESPRNDTLSESNLLSHYTPATPKLASMRY